VPVAPRSAKVFADNYLLPTVVELDGPGRFTRDELLLPFVVARGFDSLEAAITKGKDIVTACPLA
jgi:hypothetical protein